MTLQHLSPVTRLCGGVTSCVPVPYMASAEWYRLYASARLEGVDEGGARRAANDGCALRCARDFARAVVSDARGADALLSVPLAGGARAARHARPEEARISLHGGWPRVHSGALSAAYGRTPFFPHFYPEVHSLLDDVALAEPDSVRLPELSEALHDRICRGLDIEGAAEAVRMARQEVDSPASGSDSLSPSLTPLERVRAEGMRLEKEVRFGRSAIELLMRHGRRGALALLARVLMLVVILTGMTLSVSGANPADTEREPRMDVKVYTGYYRFVDEYGDTVRMTLIRDLYVYPPLKFKNKKQEEFYWRTVRDVRKTLPYAKLAFATLCETYEYIQTIPDKKQREAHLKRLEKEIFEQYKPAMKNMTKSQGKVLLKLINRETDQSSYNIVKAFLGSFRAGFWQTFGRFFGMNMKAGFHPDKNEEDAIIDRVATLIEQGTL